MRWSNSCIYITVVIVHTLKLDYSKIIILKGRNESNTSVIQKLLKEDTEILGNILSSFIIDTPNKFG